MFKINLDSEDKQLIDNYNLIKNTTKIKNKEGNVKEYVTYNCSFPYTFIEMFQNANTVFFYEKNNKIFITNERPPSLYSYSPVKLQCRKNTKQKTSNENRDKQWAKLMTVPKKIMGDLRDYSQLNYVLHINQKDFVSGKNALLEVYLT